MKKVMAIIVMVIMMMVVTVAFADGYSETYDNIWNYMEENDLIEYYNGAIDDYGVYGTIGILNTEGIKNELTSDCGSWDDLENWFAKWYEEKLMEFYPEYGEIGVGFTKIGEYNNTVIYHLTVAAENDIVDFIDGDQCIVDMLFACY